MTFAETLNSSPMIVYLIDDNPSDILIIRRVCESVGLKVRSFSSPHTFLDDFDPDSTGCIVVDLMMPEMTGLQLFERLQDESKGMPVILLTGHADASTCRAAFHAGVFDYVEKSFNSHDLLVVIRKAIEFNRQRNEEFDDREQLQRKLDLISPREREVMEKLAEGKTLKEIANEFSITVQTASKHRAKLFDKLGVSNEVELVRRLIDLDFLGNAGSMGIAAA